MSTAGGNLTTTPEGAFIYVEGMVVGLVANPEGRYRFVNWTGVVVTIGNVTAASTTITRNGDYSITANFARIYGLSISSTAGGAGTAPGEGAFPYRAGSVVSLIAAADVGYHFVDWTGDVTTIANVTAAMTSITVNSNRIITTNFAIDTYFWTDMLVALNGHSTLPAEARNPCIMLETRTSIVVDSVWLDLPDGRSVIAPRYTSLVSPGLDRTTVLCFVTCAPGMPVADGEYIFTGLGPAGEPIQGAGNTDVWVGVEPPDPPSNVRAELTGDGMLVSWDESPIIPGSFAPAAEPQLGYYQLWISRVDTGEWVYGATRVSGSPYLVPGDKAHLVEGKDFGLSLSEMEDGAYSLATCVFSIAPDGSLGKGIDCRSSDQGITFTIEDGGITIE